MLTLGLDIGTTTISIVVMDRVNKKVVETGNIPNDSFLKTENSWEKTQDAELILKKTVKLLNEYLLRYPEVESIGLTGQMHGILYLDGEGRAISLLYTWQYGGGSELIEKMQDAKKRTVLWHPEME